MANTLVQFHVEETVRIKSVNICEMLGTGLQTYLRICMSRLYGRMEYRSNEMALLHSWSMPKSLNLPCFQASAKVMGRWNSIQG